MINPLTSEQRDLARHALGLPNKARRSFRNRFYAPPSSENHGVLREMVEAGFARRAPSQVGATAELFWLTRAGADRALLPGETLDREDFPIIGQD